MITDVTVGIQLFTVTVRVFAGHTSLSISVQVINEQINTVIASSFTSLTGVPSGPMSYTIVVPFTRSGQYRFTVSARNPFGRSASKSDLYYFTGFEGIITVLDHSNICCS